MEKSYLKKIEFKDIFVILVLIGVIFTGIYTYYLYTNYQQEERVEVDLLSDGEVIDTVSAETATNSAERHTGLSETESLGNGQGMIFIYDREVNRTFVMRDMDFGLDIIFIDSNCSINSIKHAEEPVSGQTGIEPINQYNGTAKYVLEVPYKYSDAKLSEGDSVDFYEC